MKRKLMKLKINFMNESNNLVSLYNNSNTKTHHLIMLNKGPFPSLVYEDMSLIN